MNSLPLFDIALDNLTDQDLEDKLAAFLVSPGSHLIVTPNPEMFVLAEIDSTFKHILKSADLKIPDGMGLVLAARFLFGVKLNRHPGVEAVEMLCRLANREKRRVFLLGAGDGMARQAGGNLKKSFPGLQIAGAMSEADLETVRKAEPDILLVAFGHNKQEKWLAENLPKLPRVRIGMGVGGTFDFLSGRIKRAPRLLRRLGLEWLWRLCLEPRRIKRIIHAVVVFPYLVFLHKKQLNLPYRQNALGFILTRSGEFAIFKRCRERDYWQSPQGGINPGESPEEALLREVGEEIGNKNLKILFKCRERYRYNWPVKWAIRKAWRGQEQTIFLLLLADDPQNIRCDYRELCGHKLVKPPEMFSRLHPVRREGYKILIKETGGDFSQFLRT